MQQDDALPSRSAAGRAALDVFYRDFNEYSFYVEDEDQENIYFEILARFLPGVNFNKIFALNGKESVIKHAEDKDNAIIPNRVYIVDKDFDDLLGKIRNISNLYYLDKFCIENYLIEENAIIEIIIEENPKLNRIDVAASLDLPNFLENLESSVHSLFALFFLAQLEEIPIKNCGLSPEHFSTAKCRWKICNESIDTYKAEHTQKCLDSMIQPPSSPLTTDERLHGFFSLTKDKVLSGKFILKILMHYLKSKYRMGSITFEAFVYRLSKNCELNDLEKWCKELDV